MTHLSFSLPALISCMVPFNYCFTYCIKITSTRLSPDNVTNKENICSQKLTKNKHMFPLSFSTLIHVTITSNLIIKVLDLRTSS